MEDNFLNHEFSDLGKKFYAIGILLVLSFIPYIGSFFSFISIFFTYAALKRLNRINERLSNDDIYKARKYYINSILLLIIGIILVVISSIVLLVILFIINRTAIFLNISIFITVLLLGIFIVYIISFIFEKRAWASLISFFEKERGLFPKGVSDAAIKGSKMEKTGVIVEFILFLMVIVVVIIIIGIGFALKLPLEDVFSGAYIGYTIIQYVGIIISIYRAIGYFNLGQLRNLAPGYYAPSPAGTQYSEAGYQSPHPSIPVETSVKPSSCPYCGESLAVNAQFCGNCGEKFE